MTSEKLAGPETSSSVQASCLLASSGPIQGPPAFQLLEAKSPASRPSREASSSAWCIRSTDSSPRNAGPAGIVFLGSRMLATSQRIGPRKPFARISSSSRVSCSRSTCPFNQAQRTIGRAATGGDRNSLADNPATRVAASEVAYGARAATAQVAALLLTKSRRERVPGFSAIIRVPFNRGSTSLQI